MKSRRKTRLVLLGGGHAHVQVLKRWIMSPHGTTELFLVNDRAEAVYSGMVPGLVSGRYAPHEVSIDLAPLARLAKATFIIDRVVEIDPDDRVLKFQERPPIPFDIASLNVGGTVRGLDRPGVRERALATRPIHRLVDQLDQLDKAIAERGTEVRALVVGGGPAGIELALALKARCDTRKIKASVRILEAGARLLPSFPEATHGLIATELEKRHIEWTTRARVLSVEQDACVLEDASPLVFDVLLWAAGSEGHGFLRHSKLETDQDGFLLTRSTLQLASHDHLFATGDCAHLVDAPWVPKSGVYAVRQGPVLHENLMALLDGHRLKRFRPQRDALALLNLADGNALALKWGRARAGRRVMQLKDSIDRRFMRRFQALDEQGNFTSQFKRLATMDDDSSMTCAGCAAKASRVLLDKTFAQLELGKASDDTLLPFGDDAAAHQLGKEVVVTSVDAFKAFGEDHYLVGRVAAVNAASDVLAKGASPWVAHVTVSLPEHLHPDQQEQMLLSTLSGAQRELERMGATLAGGHTLLASDFSVGLCVIGRLEEDARLLPQSAVVPGQKLLLTKALGTGVVLNAAMRARASGAALVAARESMLHDNQDAAFMAQAHGATAVTDVTGFGLAGHLVGMLQASRRRARISLGRVPYLPGAERLVKAGIRSTFFQENWHFTSSLEATAAVQQEPGFELLFDPQTSGGLLIAVAAERAQALLDELRRKYPRASLIGTVLEHDAPDTSAPLSVDR